MKTTDADIRVMRQALAVALDVGPRDVPVGALVFDPDGLLISSGTNDRECANNPVGHAEIIAMGRAAEFVRSPRLDGSTLVTTLEPCVMCAGALVQARVARLVFGAFDDKAGAAGSVWDLVRDRRINHQPEVVGGVLADECAEPIRQFFADRRLT